MQYILYLYFIKSYFVDKFNINLNFLKEDLIITITKSSL